MDINTDDTPVTPRSEFTDPSDARRPFLLMSLTLAKELANLKPLEEIVFDEIIFGNRTISEVSAELKIARMTIHDNYIAAWTKMRKVITNIEGLRDLFESLKDLGFDR